MKMITGDNRLTAEAIAACVGIESPVLTGKEIEELNDATLRGVVEETDVFARVTPTQKGSHSQRSQIEWTNSCYDW